MPVHVLSVVNEPVREYVSAHPPGQVQVTLMLRVERADAPLMTQQPFIAGWTVRVAPESTKVNMVTLMFTRPKAQVYDAGGLTE